MSSFLSPISHLNAFRELIRLLTQHRQLTFAMAKREISDRYIGQVFGTLWAIGHPLVLMVVYVFIFHVVFKVRVASSVGGFPADYVIYLLSGLIPWLTFNESMVKGAVVVFTNANLVKQVVFPIEILPVKGVLSSFIAQFVSFTIILLYAFIRYGDLPWTWLLVPFLCFVQGLAMVGMSYLLSSIGVYFRDIKDFVVVFGIVGMYTMPIFYLPTMVPEIFRPILFINPFSYMIWCYQDAIYYGGFYHPWAWCVFIVMSISVFYVGYRVFRKLKLMFGNVL